MEFDLVMLDYDKVCSLGTPLHILVALQCVRNETALSGARQVSVVELNVHVLSKLVEEVLVLRVQERVTQVHQGVA